jgi:O-antigen biosynthesis protein
LPNTIIFDQYSRYRSCADILKKFVKNNETILDVGSGPECLLGQFLPELQITYLDPLFSTLPNTKNAIAGNIFTQELKQKKYDHVVCIDTFEHIPPTLRKEFLEKLYNLSEKSVIISGPCSDAGDALETDKWVNTVYRNCFNQNYSWLDEHFDNGLPKLSSILDTFENFGMHTLVAQNGHTQWLKEFLPFVISTMEFAGGKEKIFELSKYFIENLYSFDHISPSYRQIVVASKEKLSNSIISKNNVSFTEQSNFHWNYLKRQIIESLTTTIFQEQIKAKNYESKIHEIVKDVDVLQKNNIKNSSIIDTKDSELDALQRSLHTKDSELDALQRSLHTKDSEINNLQNAVENYQKMITDIHQSFVFRMLHKYDQTIGKFIPLKPKKFAKSTQQESTIKELEINSEKTLNSSLDKKDIICFPIINWDFRFQRPQHILSEFAKKGHRIFYFTVNLRQLEKSFEIKNISENIFQIEISSTKFFDIYKDKFDKSLIQHFMEKFKEIQKVLKLDAISFVEFPTWSPLVLELKKQLDIPIIFDCLDEFTGFGNVIKEREKEELSLISSSDLVLATSSHLLRKVMKNTKNFLFLPNAGEFEHFNKTESTMLSEYKKPIIGYFGSISDWFDTDLLEYLASKRPQFTFVLIGHTFGSDIRKLQEFDNVSFLGERPYSELPKYLHDFDVCLIPFKLIPLIDSTHPVKIYEYFAAGKPVVATNMIELFPMSDMCYLAKEKEDFLEKLDLATTEKNENIIKKRIKFASENTWTHRFETLYEKLKKIDSFNIDHHS